MPTATVVFYDESLWGELLHEKHANSDRALCPAFPYRLTVFP
jgi:hypothetical protein